MWAEIGRFGPVSSFKCGLDKSMTVIYGNNNIGKSYYMQNLKDIIEDEGITAGIHPNPIIQKFL